MENNQEKDSVNVTTDKTEGDKNVEQGDSTKTVSALYPHSSGKPISK